MLVTIIPLLLTLAGASNDALDYLPTNVYWQAKGVTPAKELLLAELQADAGGDVTQLIKELSSDEFAKREAATHKILAKGASALPQLKEAANSNDPEIASRAKVMIEELTNRAPAQKIRRLMAIRTIGEMKEKDAVPVLVKLIDAKEPFVGDYARRAIATIENKRYVRPPVGPSAEDLWVLPAGCGVVGQFAINGGRPSSVGKILEQMPILTHLIDVERGELPAKTQQKLLALLEMTGNLRFDSATVAISSEFTNGSPKFIIIEVRGQFDQNAVMEAMKKIDTPKDRNGLEIFGIDGGGRLAFLNGNRIVLISGEGDENLPIDELFNAIESGKGKLNTDASIAKLLESVNTKSPLWAVANVSDAYRQSPLLVPLNTAVLSAQTQDNKLFLELGAEGSDAAKVKGALDLFSQSLNNRLDGLKAATPTDATKLEFDFLESIKVESHDSRVLLKATLNDAGVFGGILNDGKD